MILILNFQIQEEIRIHSEETAVDLEVLAAEGDSAEAVPFLDEILLLNDIYININPIN